MSDAADLHGRIEILEGELAKMKAAFLAHWKWHRGEEQRLQGIARDYHERMGIVYAVAPSYADAREGCFCYGPTSDLVDLRDTCPAEEGHVIVLMENVSGKGAQERRIVTKYVAGKWEDVYPPEELP